MDVQEDRYPAVFALAANLTADQGAKKILSFGASTGREAHTLADKYFPNSTIVGVDVDEGALTKARRFNRNIADRVHFFNSMVLPLDTLGEYDIIFANSVLCVHPLPRPAFLLFQETLEKLDSVLRPGGLLVAVNTNYRIEDTSVAPWYSSTEAHGMNEQKGAQICGNFVPLFDKEHHEVELRDRCIYRKSFDTPRRRRRRLRQRRRGEAGRASPEGASRAESMARRSAVPAAAVASVGVVVLGLARWVGTARAMANGGAWGGN